jgi:hypothetical protein
MTIVVAAVVMVTASESLRQLLVQAAQPETARKKLVYDLNSLVVIQLLLLQQQRRLVHGRDTVPAGRPQQQVWSDGARRTPTFPPVKPKVLPGAVAPGGMQWHRRGAQGVRTSRGNVLFNSHKQSRARSSMDAPQCFISTRTALLLYEASLAQPGALRVQQRVGPQNNTLN